MRATLALAVRSLARQCGASSLHAALARSASAAVSPVDSLPHLPRAVRGLEERIPPVIDLPITYVNKILHQQVAADGGITLSRVPSGERYRAGLDGSGAAAAVQAAQAQAQAQATAAADAAVLMNPRRRRR